jgi:hypothetical protein
MQMLEAMCRARFSIWRIERRHDTCGHCHVNFCWTA